MIYLYILIYLAGYVACYRYSRRYCRKTEGAYTKSDRLLNLAHSGTSWFGLIVFSLMLMDECEEAKW